jgi:hypothetical protein
MNCPAARFRQRLIRLLWVVEDYNVRAATGQNAPDRRREPPAASHGLEIVDGLATPENVAG